MPRSTLVMAMFTQSVGVPSTAYTRSEMVSSLSGRRSVSACPIALASVNGATTVTSPSGLQRIGERFDAFRVHAVIVGHQNTFHMTGLSVGAGTSTNSSSGRDERERSARGKGDRRARTSFQMRPNTTLDTSAPIPETAL